MHTRSRHVPTAEFEEFVRIVRKLRRECPWDREQTHQSLRPSLIEETYEVIEALDEDNLDELKNELGDLLLHIVLHATIAEEENEFTLKAVLSGINKKLIRRHPHVFGSTTVRDASEVRQNWERLKMHEGRTSVLQGVPKGMPALQRALRVQQRAARVGFDWENREHVWKKVREELEELHETIGGRATTRCEEEFGDLLFSLVNFARFIDINPETSLRRTIEKFTTRFQYIERELGRQGKDIHDSTLEEMDVLWNEVKRKRRARSTGRRRAGKKRG